MTKKYIAVSIVLLTLIPALYACECCKHTLQTEIIIEEMTELESWMVVPFDSYILEEEVSLECWMTVPFEITPSEEEAELEC